MKGLRAKFLFLLIVYFAGFSTAIYCMCPPPEQQAGTQQVNGTQRAQLNEFNRKEFVKSFNIGMHKCMDLGKDAALKTAEYIREKIDDKQKPADS